jgi:hypothetical protein
MVAYGDYVLAHVPNVTDQEVKELKARATGAITTCRDQKKQVITRDKFTLLPMPPSVIEYLYGIAEKKKRKISKDIYRMIGYDIYRHINKVTMILKALSINWLIVQPSVFTTG